MRIIGLPALQLGQMVIDLIRQGGFRGQDFKILTLELGD